VLGEQTSHPSSREFSGHGFQPKSRGKFLRKETAKPLKRRRPMEKLSKTNHVEPGRLVAAP